MKLWSQRGDLKHFARGVPSLPLLFGLYLWIQMALYVSKTMSGVKVNGWPNKWLAMGKS